MKKTPFYRRYPLSCALLLLLLTTTVTLAVILTHFDLARARHFLTQELSQALQQPVGIGKLNLTYQQGLAVEIHNLGIGDGEVLDIRVPRLTGVLRLRPLLQGELLLDRVFLNKPQITLSRTGSTGTPARESISTKTGDLFKKFGLSLLTIRHGRADLSQDQLLPGRLPDQIENLNLVLRGWQTQQSGYLVVSGALPDNKGQFTIETELPPPAQLPEWRQQQLKLKVDLKHVSRTLIPTEVSEHLPNTFNSTIHLDGSPARGATFQLELSDSGSDKKLLAAGGRWVSHQTTEQLRELQVQLLGLPFQGQLHFDRSTTGNRFQGRLSGSNIPLQPLAQNWNLPRTDQILAGTIKKAAVEFNGSLNKGDSNQPDDDFHYQASAVLEDGRLALGEQGEVTEISLSARLDQQTLKITQGLASWRKQPLTFQGEVRNWSSDPHFTIQGTAAVETALIHQLFPDSLPQRLTLRGVAQTRIALDGKPGQIRGTLESDLDAVQTELQPLLVKRPDQKASLQLVGSWQPEQLQLELAQLQIGDTQIAAATTIPIGGQTQPVTIEAKKVDLFALRPFSPLLEKLKAQGALTADLHYTDATQFNGIVDLDGTGAHLTWLIGDIKSANGRVDFNQDGLDFEQLSARLGSSPVQIDGNLRNWKNFLLDLRVRGEEIGARDLVFANQDMVVFELDGRLLINKGGIIFDPVQVQLENGTDATVSGYVRNFSDPETYLEIDSFEHVDVLEIIKLFTGPPKKTATQRKKPGQPVRILARAAQGTLGGLKFQQAEGLITVNRGLFTLHPLAFKHQDGYCLARVEYEDGLLKISGHLEDFNASTLHRQALHARGLVTGTLRGDFYLEGNGTGDKFWASARGGAHLEVYNGALRKFRSLARVFSLLNISQLFELKLPDMDSKGMPFTLLQASVKINEGIISTENLNIQSNAMNMSLIGNRNLLEDTLDLTVGVKPLRTVDKIITAIPVAGWLLAGEEKALLTAHFKVQGPASDPDVIAIPASSLSKTVLGIIKRTFKLPGKMISDPAKLFPQGPSAPPPSPERKPAPGQKDILPSG